MEQFSKLPPPSLTREERQDVISFVRRKAEIFIFPSEARHILCDSYNDVYKRILLLGGQNASHVFVCRTMSVLLDISCSKSVPRNVMCDICVFYPSKPVMVLTFTTQATHAASQYNSNVAKAVMVYINNDLFENLSVINGVIDMSMDQSFLSRISELETSAKDFAIPNNMKMDEKTALRVLTSFLKIIPKSDRNDTGRCQEDEDMLPVPKPMDARLHESSTRTAVSEASKPWLRSDARYHSDTSVYPTSLTFGGGEKEGLRSKRKTYDSRCQEDEDMLPVPKPMDARLHESSTRTAVSEASKPWLRSDARYHSDTSVSSTGSTFGGGEKKGLRSKKKTYDSRCIELLHIAQTLGEHVAVYLP
ncbi:uncharacterized protein LOC124131252 isoform X2 [Haliotis rufescens]|uniref:uncharacterized protein LOC124131252 isoform X2 n=1 Tax=Haliotis rufescens TaxID=6454 RepID=UPI00201F7EF2|nr:uncharacterized protein LOC124131252 isoform X2 [Haliotis rufescens]